MSSLKLTCLACVVLGSLAGSARAQQQAADGPVMLRYGVSHWDGSPEADLLGATVLGAGTDSLDNSGWWLRIEGVDTREFPMPAPTSVFPDAGNGVLFASWTNLRGSGVTVQERITVANLESSAGNVVSTLFVSNFGPTTRTIHVFHYLDPSPGGGWQARESVGALPTTPNALRFDGAQIINGNPVLLDSVVYRSGSADARQCGTGTNPVSALLNDGDVDTLNNGGYPTGLVSGSLNCAFEWAGVALGQNGGAQFQVAVSGGQGRLTVKGDIDSDGLTDLILRSTETPPGSGYDSFATWGMLRTVKRRDIGGIGAVSIAYDDFNRDYENDQLYRDPFTGGVTVFYGKSGLTPFGWNLQNAPTLAFNWTIAATADFNADGYPDILWRNTTSQNLVIWTVQGHTKIGNIIPSPSAAVDANWEVVGAHDVNADGHPDLIFCNTTSGNVVIWYMDANMVRITGSFTTPASPTGTGWRVVATGDYGLGTGAELPAVLGSADLIWQNQVSGRLVFWHLNRAGERTSGGLLTPDLSPGYQVVGPR